MLFQNGDQFGMKCADTPYRVGRISGDDDLLQALRVEFEFQRYPSEFRRIQLDMNPVVHLIRRQGLRDNRGNVAWGCHIVGRGQKRIGRSRQLGRYVLCGRRAGSGRCASHKHGR